MCAAEWALLGASGADVRIARCDAADPAAVRRLLAGLAGAAVPRLCGVWRGFCQRQAGERQVMPPLRTRMST